MVTEEAKVTLAMMHLSKKELRSQFFPENVEIFARRKLHELKHTDSIREVETVARTKLHEQRVQDLTSTYATIERLFDLSNDSQEASLASDSDDKLGQTEREVDQTEECDFPRIRASKLLSSLQKKGLTRDEPTFMAIPLHSLENSGDTVPKDILCVLEKYCDMMPDSLPKSLLLRRMIDHEIKLVPGEKPSAKNAYRMTPPKLTEL
ncbi:RNA-directed DNA polymerase-like protein [Cucumis melo var. makuwa]|uniref:RNA-directed DNA polymerase-like protein n=1 Tax=Cucumis melo var. makuwa TaxID=1194695 RepID=A0A5D3E011_CUCMM|nr:RNA-directed DNA polymerase-like protein [Cucumis melo var. makuwa]TYK29048.1 RNA-directed DNA polymerase-like protein [Cucumis melo var. makuwa]